MKKKIAILGSTGSIGKNLIKIIEKNSSEFNLILLTTYKNYQEILRQANKLKVKNIIIIDSKSYQVAIKKNNNKKLKIFNSFNHFDKIFKFKIDYTMSAIIGLDGLSPTLNIIKHTKIIAIANKESIICGWNLLAKELKKHRTKFIPVDSEHFSIWFATNDNITNIDKIVLTASGGPFFKLPLNKFKNINISDALKHPNWKMGKKISIDSATMMNKVFEIIEAKKIFNITYNNISILIHPSSYVHALIKFSNGMIKIIAHETDMKIPIYNTLYSYNTNNINTNNIDIKKLNSLELENINKNKYPSVKILKNLPEKNSLFETILVSANDEFVKLFLEKKIKFTDISKKLIRFLKLKEFTKYKSISPKNINDIIKLNNYVRIKINSKGI